jgi:hypothetical protein
VTSITKKCKVFISSSFIDLEKERATVIMSTLKRNHIPTGMELFTPVASSGAEFIKEEIKDSDIFVLLLGARSGSKISSKPGSLAFTQQEYRWAIEFKIPIIVFMLSDDEYKKYRDNINSDDSERKYDTDLRNFRDEVKKYDEEYSRIVGFFSYDNTAKLSDDYGNSLRNLVNDLENTAKLKGWIKYYYYESLKNETEGKIVLDNTLSTNPFIKNFATKLTRFGKLSNRALLQIDLKQGAANYFWDRYFSKLYQPSIKNIYFESGSSIAYVSESFIDYVKNNSESFYGQDIEQRIAIHTNNLFTYLNFILLDKPWRQIKIEINPQGIFSDDYGGTYGKLNFAVPKSAPLKNERIRERLDSATQIIVDQVVKEFNDVFDNSSLILMTASGIDTRPYDVLTPYPGPHVGSYPNMLLKRCLLSVNAPKVIFLDPKKWNFDFKYGNCHPVCDASYSWDYVIHNTPLAIALAANSREEQGVISKQLVAQGFNNLELEEAKAGSTGPWSIIASNDKFKESFE